MEVKLEFADRKNGQEIWDLVRNLLAKQYLKRMSEAEAENGQGDKQA